MSRVSEITNIFDAFKNVNVLIIGDAMIDRYVYGSISRMSPEAPVPVFDIISSEDCLGGAANVALNVKKLGGTPIIVSIVGNDEDGQKMLKLLHQHDIYSTGITLAEGRKTTVKTRMISDGKHVYRLDHEMRHGIDERFEIALIDSTVDLIDTNKPNVILLQDYNKGVLTNRIIKNLIHIGHELKIPIVVDPKIENFFDYQGCTLFKPNLREASDSLGRDLSNASEAEIRQAATEIRQRLNCAYTILTLSEKGMLIDEEGDSMFMPAYQRNVADVSGAGDTVISVLAMGLALGLDMFATTELANIAGGLVCEKVGVRPLEAEELIAEAERIMSMDEEEETQQQPPPPTRQEVTPPPPIPKTQSQIPQERIQQQSIPQEPYLKTPTKQEKTMLPPLDDTPKNPDREKTSLPPLTKD